MKLIIKDILFGVAHVLLSILLIEEGLSNVIGVSSVGSPEIDSFVFLVLLGLIVGFYGLIIIKLPKTQH